MKNIKRALAAAFLLMLNGCASNTTNLVNNHNMVTDQLFVKQIEEIVKSYSQYNWFAGSVLVMKDGNVIYDRSVGFADIANNVRNTSSTKIRIGSINKHFTAALVLQSVQSGDISLDDSLSKFELGFPNTYAHSITIRHLLQHTSGFADIFTDQYFNTYKTLKTINDKLPLLINEPLIAVPGEQYNYSNYGYIVLGAILEKVKKKSFKEILQQHILDVIGAKDTEYALTDQVKNKALSYHFTPTGNRVDRTPILENVTPDGGMYSTPHDLALFYSKLFYSNALINDEIKATLVNGYKSTDGNWAKILASAKAAWNSYGGGPGVSAAVELLIKDRLMVVVLANTDGLVAEQISQRIISAYQNQKYPEVLLPIGLFVTQTLSSNGNQYLIDHAQQLFVDAGYNNLQSRTLNKPGFVFLKEGDVDKAISVFITNTKLFPGEANVFDSLAYAYEKVGDNAKAIENYKIALVLNPNFESAKEGLNRLTKNSRRTKSQ